MVLFGCVMFMMGLRNMKFFFTFKFQIVLVHVCRGVIVLFRLPSNYSFEVVVLCSS